MSGRGLQFDVCSSNEELAALEPEWAELFDRTRSQNAFAHPGWLRAWLHEFVPDARRRRVLFVRRNGELVAVAPFYHRRVGRGRTLQLVGAPIHEDPVTELSEILVLPELRYRVLNAVVGELVANHAHGCDWLGLTLPAGHGWFNDDWIPASYRRRGAFAVHKGVRAFSILPLAASWEEQPLKPNVRNALNRSANRHARLEGHVEVRFAEGSEAGEAARLVQDLHRRRAGADRGVAHPDYFSDERVAQLAVEGVAALADAGRAYVALCTVDGEPLAGRVVLRAGGQTFLSYSGFDPSSWQLSSLTLLQTAVIRRAITQGDATVNLSLNPDAAKQRWTHGIELHNEFVVVAPSRRSRILFALFWQARAARALRDKRLWTTIASDAADGS